MDINKDDITRMTALGDDLFKQKLETTLNAAGASDSVKQKLIHNIPQIKKALNGLSQKDLELLTQKLDSETLGAIKDSLSE